MQSKTKLIIVGAIFCLIFLALTVVALIFQTSSRNENGSGSDVDQNTYVDPVSGETVLDPEGKVVEGEIVQEGAPLILGIPKLLDYGVSSQQASLINYYLEEYGFSHKDSPINITEISLDTKSIKQTTDKSSGQKNITANIVVNRETTQRLLLSYVSVNDMLVRIYDTDNNQVFISEYD